MGKPKLVEIDKSHPHYEQLMQKDRARRAQMSPPEKLRLPRLLEMRRQEYGIMDGVFAAQPPGERILVYQIVDAYMEEGKAGADSQIIVPDTVMDSERRANPRGVLVAAGFKALDIMKTNGLQLGHIVWFGAHHVWSRRIGMQQGVWDYVVPLNIGDLQGSEDLEQMRRQRLVRVKWDKEKKEHLFVDSNGEEWLPECMWQEGGD